MEYYKVYLDTKNTIIRKIEKEIKFSLVTFKNEERTFNYCLDQIREKLLKRISELESPLRNEYSEATDIFKKHEEIYSNNSIEKILNKEVYNKFKKIIVPEKISYDEYIIHLSEFITILAIHDKLIENKDTFREVYSKNKIKQFSLNKFLLVEKVKTHQGIDQNKDSKQEETIPNNNHKTILRQKIEAQINSFSEEEKCLLMHYALVAVPDSINDSENWNYNYTIPYSEFVKIMCICNIEDYQNIFLTKKASDIGIYRKIVYGISQLDKNGGKLKRIKKINTLINKLKKNKELGLNKTIEFFERFKIY